MTFDQFVRILTEWEGMPHAVKAAVEEPMAVELPEFEFARLTRFKNICAQNGITDIHEALSNITLGEI